VVLFIEFAKLCENLASTSSKNKKVELMADFIKALDEEELTAVVSFLTSKSILPSLGLNLRVGYVTLFKILCEATSISPRHLHKVYVKYGDLGDAAYEVFSNKGLKVKPLISRDLSIRIVKEKLVEAGTFTGEHSTQYKRDSVLSLLLNCTPLEAKYLTKVILGDLRIEVSTGLVLEALSKAYNLSLDDVRHVTLYNPYIDEVAVTISRGEYKNIGVKIMRPLAFMLAQPLQMNEIADHLKEHECIAEYKYDGVRVQLHKKGKDVELFSRRLEKIGRSFPEILQAGKRLPEELVLDGELLAVKDDRPLHFTLLQRRLRRKKPDETLIQEIPVEYNVFDILYLNGKELTSLQYLERRKILESILKENVGIRLAPIFEVEGEEKVRALFEESIGLGYEGLMLKDVAGPYQLGSRGYLWVKLKRPLTTLTVVVTAVEWGHGKRSGLLSDYTFAVRDEEGRLLNIGKAYSGLTDEEIKYYTNLFKNLAVGELPTGYRVRPEIVLEVAFNSIQKSTRHESGFALRFPRIERMRPDLSVNDIDTIDIVKKIYESQEVKPE